MKRIRDWWLRIRAVPALREIGIVTVGILIAFALDAWWAQRATAARERAHLRALRSDFQQNAERLDSLITLHEGIAASSHELLILSQRGGPSLPPDSVWRLVGVVMTSNRFEPVMGAYEELENSAGLALLRNDSMRAALATFAAQLDVRHAEQFSDEVFLSLVREFAGELPFWAPYVVGESNAVRLQGEVQRLLRTTKFQEHLALRHVSARDVAHEYRRLAQQARTILAHSQ